MPMRTIVLACMKGGSGKTTMAGHLAVTLERAGEGPVAVIDLDPQESMAKWWNRREAAVPAFAKPANIRAGGLAVKLEQLAQDGYRWCIVDTPPAKGDVNAIAIQAADLVVVPVKPSPHDLDAAQATVDMCKAAGKRFFFLLNEIKIGTRLPSDAVMALSVLGPVAPVMVGNRIAYQTSMINGRTIAEAFPGKQGEEEQVKFGRFIVEQFPETRKPKKEKAHV